MDTKKLRQKILDLAIHGKLVPQDPNDEPASVLLERIRAEKEQLIKEGKIKAPKKSKTAGDTSHYPKEVPWELPEGWAWIYGQDLFSPMESISPKGDYFDYIDIDAIDNQRNIISSPKRIPVKNAPSRASRKTRRGDVLFSMVRPYLRNIARVDYDNCIASTGFYVCHSSGLVTSNYCFILMLSNYVVEGLNQYMKGDNSPSINNNHITSWLYPVPPISEQERISAAVDKLLNCIDVLFDSEKRIFESIVTTKTKILDLAVHGKLVPQDPSDEPAAELLKRINPAFQPSHNLHYIDSIPAGWVCCPLYVVCEILDSQRKPINSKEREKRVEKATTLFPYYGATGQVGVIDDYIFDGNYLLLGEDGAPFLDRYAKKAYPVSGKIWVNNHAHILRPRINAMYMMCYLNAINYRPYVTGTTRLKLTQEAMRSIPVLVPPLAEQERITSRIDILFHVIDEIQLS